jgi:acetolactate synthase-1/2/3 large subunit
MRRTGAEIVLEYLIAAGVPNVFGIPGHGDVALFDAALERRDRIATVMTIHEQGAAHMADGFYRASGQPCAVFTSVGPGACNTLTGVAQAYVDSTALMVLTGSPHTYMRGRSVLQEVDRQQWADFPSVLRPVTKQSWQVSHVDQLPFVMHRAWNRMLSGRPGPVHLDLPMDVQAEATDAPAPDLEHRVARSRPRPDAAATERAARLLAGAQRPVVIAGGGVITAGAGAAVREIAEHVGAAILTTWMGKGAVPEDHELYGLHPGSPGSSVANTLLHTADVILAVGCRFTDWSFSSFHADYFLRPDAALIQVDVDPAEIGKNTPVAIDLVADAGAAANDLLAALRDGSAVRDWRGSAYHAEIARLRAAWDDELRPAREREGSPTTVSRALAEIRRALPRDGIVVGGAGLPQNQLYQEFPVYEPRTHISSGGFSTMGFTVPGAIGVKLAAPGRAVVGVAGDGDFLDTVQELAVAAQLDLGVVYVVLNNQGFTSIKTLQEGLYGPGRAIATEFRRRGADYSPDFAALARDFGLRGERVEDPAGIAPALSRAIAAGGPAVIEVPVGKQGLTKAGWWDVPVPAYLPAHADWLANRAREVR